MAIINDIENIPETEDSVKEVEIVPCSCGKCTPFGRIFFKSGKIIAFHITDHSIKARGRECMIKS
jgi:hypothetical protein